MEDGRPLILFVGLSDMNQGTIGSMKELGVTESYKLKRQVVISASEAAEMIIRCVAVSARALAAALTRRTESTISFAQHPASARRIDLDLISMCNLLASHRQIKSAGRTTRRPPNLCRC